MNSPTTSPICTARPAAATPNCSTSPTATTPRDRPHESGLPHLPGPWRLSPVVGRPAQTGVAMRCRRRPLRPTAEVAAGLRTAAAGTVSRDRATDWLRAYLAQRGPVICTEVRRCGSSGHHPHRVVLGANIGRERAPAAGARCRCPAHVELNVSTCHIKDYKKSPRWEGNLGLSVERV